MSSRKNSHSLVFALLAGAALFVVSSLLSGCGGKSLPPGAAEYADGLAALYEGDTLSAHELFKAAEDADPGRPWRLLGEAHLFEAYGAELDALRRYREATEIAPDFDSGYTGYVRIALDANKRKLAERMIVTYGERFDLSPDGPDSPSQRTYAKMRSRIALSAGEYELADKEIAPLLQIAPDDFEAQALKARILWGQGETDDAVAIAEKLSEDADSRLQSKVAASLAVSVKSPDLAVELIKQLQDEYPKDVDITRFVFSLYLRLGYLDYADVEISRLRDQGFQEDIIWYLRAKFLEQLGEFRRAYLTYEYALSLFQQSENIYRDMARAAIGAKSFIQMEDALGQILSYAQLRNDPQLYIDDIRMELAEYYSVRGQWNPSLQALTAAEPSYGGTARLEFLRVHVLKNTLLTDSAITLLNKLATSLADNVNLEWAQGFARSWAELNELDSVSKYLDIASQIAPKNYGVIMARAQLALQRNDSAAYRDNIQTLVNTYPTDKQALRAQAGIYSQMGDDIRTLEVANLLIKIYPGDLNLYRLASLTAGRRYGAEQGREYLDRALENNPSLPAVHHMFATIHLSEGKKDSAQMFIDQALDLDSLYVPAMLAQAVLLESEGHIDSAAAQYTKIIQLRPYYAEAYNNLAWLLATNDIDLPRATNLAREAISISGGTKANMHGTLGWTYFKRGKYDNADIAYQTAIRLDPNDPFKHYLRGINFEAWEKKEEAIEELNKALELGISGIYLEETRKALQRLGS